MESRIIGDGFVTVSPNWDILSIKKKRFEFQKWGKKAETKQKIIIENQLIQIDWIDFISWWSSFERFLIVSHRLMMLFECHVLFFHSKAPYSPMVPLASPRIRFEWKENNKKNNAGEKRETTNKSWSDFYILHSTFGDWLCAWFPSLSIACIQQNIYRTFSIRFLFFFLWYFILYCFFSSSYPFWANINTQCMQSMQR